MGNRNKLPLDLFGSVHRILPARSSACSSAVLPMFAVAVIFQIELSQTDFCEGVRKDLPPRI